MIKSYEERFEETFSNEEIKSLKEILNVIRKVFKKSTNKEVKLFLIGMKALYYYFGTKAFEPAPKSIDIDINFDILLEWANYRKLIPQKIKDSLESLGYNVNVELGLITIQKEDIVIHLTTVIEYSEEYLGDYISELDLSVGDKNFLIYTKLSRFDQNKDVIRLKNLAKNRGLEVEKILSFASDLEKEIIEKRIDSLFIH